MTIVIGKSFVFFLPSAAIVTDGYCVRPPVHSMRPPVRPSVPNKSAALTP